eukprot:1811435-Rhodomonas_salina.5
MKFSLPFHTLWQRPTQFSTGENAADAKGDTSRYLQHLDRALAVERDGWRVLDRHHLPLPRQAFRHKVSAQPLLLVVALLRRLSAVRLNHADVRALADA